MCSKSLYRCVLYIVNKVLCPAFRITPFEKYSMFPAGIVCNLIEGVKKIVVICITVEVGEYHGLEEVFQVIEECTRRYLFHDRVSPVPEKTL